MSAEDGDDPLEEGHVRLEARFRELEQEVAMEQLRTAMGRPQPMSPGRAQHPEPEGLDPLAAMKSALDHPAPAEGALIVLCPSCKAQNRVNLVKVRRLTPLCGQCKEELVVWT